MIKNAILHPHSPRLAQLAAGGRSAQTAVFCFIVALLTVSPRGAKSADSHDYQVLSGDINGDGHSDILIRDLRTLLIPLVDGTILPIPHPERSDALLLSAPDGRYAYYHAGELTEESLGRLSQGEYILTVTGQATEKRLLLTTSNPTSNVLAIAVIALTEDGTVVSLIESLNSDALELGTFSARYLGGYSAAGLAQIEVLDANLDGQHDLRLIFEDGADHLIYGSRDSNVPYGNALVSTPVIYDAGDVAPLERFLTGAIDLEGIGAGAYYVVSGGHAVFASDYIPVDPSKDYRLSGRFRSAGHEQSKVFFGLVPYDSDGRQIRSQEVSRWGSAGAAVIRSFSSQSITTDHILDPKDTAASYPAYKKYLGFYFDGDTDHRPDVVWTSGAGVYYSASGAKIQLTSVLPSEIQERIRPGVTRIMQHSANATYMYPGSRGGRIPFNWETVANDRPITGEGFLSSHSGHFRFWLGTRYVRVILIANYGQSEDFVLHFDDIVFSESRGVGETCSLTAECQFGVCSDSLCVPELAQWKIPDGYPCAKDADCSSSICREGYCGDGSLFNCYQDTDGDGFGAPGIPYRRYSGRCGSQESRNSGDCNDADPGIHPNASEVCNSRDDDCDGSVDESLGSTLSVCTSATADRDGDGIPDDVEIFYGLDHLTSDASTLDSDGDGLSNLYEYITGRNPSSATDIGASDISSREVGRFSYDDLGHLQEVVLPDSVLRIEYDASGNRTQHSISPKN